MAAADLTAQELRNLLSYDQETGVFTWLTPKSCNGKTVTVAGSLNRQRIRIRIFNKAYFAHRLAWLYVTGSWPVDAIDHIDGNPLNNRFANLRQATQGENLQNYKKPSTNTSGYIGVRRHNNTGKWEASISFAKKRKYLGVYETPLLAHMAYLEAKKTLHTFNPTVRD